MQAALTDAEAKLAAAEADLGRPAGRPRRPARAGRRTIASIYEQGDPELLAFASLLDAETAADLTRRRRAPATSIVGRETRAYDELQAAEVLLEVRENQVDDAQDDGGRPADEAAAEHLVAMRDSSRPRPQAAKDSVRRPRRRAP